MFYIWTKAVNANILSVYCTLYNVNQNSKYQSSFSLLYIFIQGIMNVLLTKRALSFPDTLIKKLPEEKSQSRDGALFIFVENSMRYD